MIIKFAFKSTRGLVQLCGAVAFGLLGAALAVSSWSRYSEETRYRAVVAALARGEWLEAKRELPELAARRPNDATLKVLLGHLALARPSEDAPRTSFDQAAAHYKEALEKEPGRASASVGLAVARLRAADLAAGAEKKALVEEAAGAVENASAADQDVAADVTVARAAVAMARQSWKGASSLFAELKEKGVPSRESTGSYYWHKGVLGVLARDPTAIDDLRRAYLFHPTDDVAKALALALRMACADPAYPSPKGFELGVRADLARRIVLQKLQGNRGGLRYSMSETERGSVHNAIGIGFVRANKLEEAKQAFLEAGTGMTTGGGLFRMNRGETLRLIAESKEKTSGERGAVMLEAASELKIAADKFEGDTTRAQLRQTLYVNSAILQQEGGLDPVKCVEQVADARKAGLPEKEAERIEGIIYDRGKTPDRAKEHYQRAVKLGTQDAFKIEVRLERLRQLLQGGR